MTHYPRVAVVVLNWQRPSETIACLQSLGRMDYPNWEAVVVDNGASGDLPAAINGLFPHAKIISNGRNLGFAAGNNVGIGYALAEGAEFVLLLNDDAEVAPDALRRLVDLATSDRAIGMAGPTIYYFAEPDVIWSAGGRTTGRGEAQHHRLNQRDTAPPGPPRDVDYVTGCAMLVSKEVIQRVGYLDERFFAYFEETEWCARAREAGFRVVHLPSARVWHKIDRTEQRSSSRIHHYLMARNRLLYLRCSGARPVTTVQAALDLTRTAAAWLIRPRHRHMRPYSTALLRGICDFTLGRFGAPPARLMKQEYGSARS